VSSAGNKTVRFLLAGARDTHVPYVRCVGWKPRFRPSPAHPVNVYGDVVTFTSVTLRYLRQKQLPFWLSTST